MAVAVGQLVTVGVVALTVRLTLWVALPRKPVTTAV